MLTGTFDLCTTDIEIYINRLWMIQRIGDKYMFIRIVDNRAQDKEITSSDFEALKQNHYKILAAKD